MLHDDFPNTSETRLALLEVFDHLKCPTFIEEDGILYVRALGRSFKSLRILVKGWGLRMAEFQWRSVLKTDPDAAKLKEAVNYANYRSRVTAVYSETEELLCVSTVSDFFFLPNTPGPEAYIDCYLRDFDRIKELVEEYMSGNAKE